MQRYDAACSSIESSAHTQRYEFAAFVFVGRGVRWEHLQRSLPGYFTVVGTDEQTERETEMGGEWPTKSED